MGCKTPGNSATCVAAAKANWFCFSDNKIVEGEVWIEFSITPKGCLDFGLFSTGAFVFTGVRGSTGLLTTGTISLTRNSNDGTLA